MILGNLALFAVIAIPLGLGMGFSLSSPAVRYAETTGLVLHDPCSSAPDRGTYPLTPAA